MEPKLSIITPVYNNVRFIEHCIANVIAQGVSDQVEHLIIDGGSSDGTVEKIRTLAEQHSHIIWQSEPDTGQSAAMNKGLRRAKSDTVCFLNVDDFFEENTLVCVLNKLKNRTHPFLLLGNCKIWNDAGELIKHHKAAKASFLRILADREIPPNPSAYFYSKSLHQNVGFYSEDNHASMDVDFILAVGQIISFTRFDEDWGNFRLIKGTKTHANMHSKEGTSVSIQKYDAVVSKLPFAQRFLIQLRRLILKLNRIKRLILSKKK